jgi:hypothetical protein
MKKVKLGITDNGFGGVLLKVINDKVSGFYCEHCGPMRRKVYYQTGTVNWCKDCADTFNLVDKKPKTKFKDGQQVTYLNSFGDKVKAIVLYYSSETYLDVMVPQPDGGKVRITLQETDLSPI